MPKKHKRRTTTGAGCQPSSNHRSGLAQQDLSKFVSEVRTAFAGAVRATEASLSDLTSAQKKIHAKRVKEECIWREKLYENKDFLKCLNGFLLEHNKRKAAIKAAIRLIIRIELLLISFKSAIGLPETSHKWFAKQKEVNTIRKKILKLCNRKEEDMFQRDVARALSVLLEPIDSYTHFPMMFDDANRPKAGGKSSNKNSTWRGWRVRELSGDVSKKTESRDTAIAGLLSFISTEKFTGDQVNKFLLSRKKDKTTKSALDTMNGKQ